MFKQILLSIHQRHFIALALIIVSFYGYGQDISLSNLTWTVTNAKSAKEIAPFTFNCLFKTNADSTLDWIQGPADNLSVSHYNVTGTDGQWSDVSKDGQVTLHVDDGRWVAGTISFTRSGGAISSRLQFSFKGNPDLDYVFTISDVSKTE